MDEEVYRKYRKAGRVAADARDYGVKQVAEGVSYLEVVELVERRIRDAGAEIAFPVNVSVNEVAAHFTPDHTDKHVFRRGDVVKLDVGAHVDGYIADTAVTVEVGSERYRSLIDASREALSRVVETVKPGVRLNEIGRIVFDTVTSRGFKPVENLSGHSLRRYLLHAGLSIPNVPGSTNEVLRRDQVLAIEPFASTGRGRVVSRGVSNIYRYVRMPLFRDVKTRVMVKKIKLRFNTLPFAERWCTSFIPDTKNGLRRMVAAGSIYGYPQLVDEDGGVVSQHEHTVIVTDDGCEVTT